MEPRQDPTAAEALLHFLQPGERIEIDLTTSGAVLHVTDRRFLVTDATGVRLDIPLRLSPRQIEILEQVSKGLSYRQIAGMLSITEPTVRNYMGASSR